jgi:transposase-like protein
LILLSGSYEVEENKGNGARSRLSPYRGISKDKLTAYLRVSAPPPRLLKNEEKSH